MNIIEPTSNFDFSNKLYLGTPSVVSSGVYFTPLFLNDKSVVVQSPPCTTKQGIKNGAGKKVYTDLVFNSNDVFFIDWMENLQAAVQQIIATRDWFEKRIDAEELETMFVSCFKLYKSGKKYLFRTNVKGNAPIYDQYINKGEILSQKDVLPDKTTMICILEIQGIRFTSQSFQFEVEVKQIAVVSPDPYLDTCFVKIAATKVKAEPEPELSEPSKEEDKPMNLLPTSTMLLNDVDETIKEELELTSTTLTEPLTKPTSSDTEIKAKVKEDDNEFSMLSSDDINEVKQALNVSFNPSVNVQTIPAAKPKGKKAGGIKIIEDLEPKPGSNPSLEENSVEQKNNDSLLDFEDMNESPLLKEEKKDEIEEIVLDNIVEATFADTSSLVLKKPDEIYQELFRAALEKADEAKRQADQLYLEADEIKQKYALQNV
jgi:hypothetical protein